MYQYLRVSTFLMEKLVSWSYRDFASAFTYCNMRNFNMFISRVFWKILFHTFFKQKFTIIKNLISTCFNRRQSKRQIFYMEILVDETCKLNCDDMWVLQERIKAIFDLLVSKLILLLLKWDMFDSWILCLVTFTLSPFNWMTFVNTSEKKIKFIDIN